MLHRTPFLTILLASFTAAFPTRSNSNPTPVCPFTVAAFASPFPAGTNNSLSGVVMQAKGGSFWLNPINSKPSTSCGNLYKHNCPPGDETVLWVDINGASWLDSANPQQVYMDTQTGILSYLTAVSSPPSTFSPGALVLNFLHLGQGTSVSVPIPGEPGFANVGPATFQWQGISSNPYWFACPRPGQGYQVMKDVGGWNDWNACLSGIQLVALDYTGANPAAGNYL